MFELPLSREKLDSILLSLRVGLENLLGGQLSGVYLYGSHARGDARPDSDIDVLVVLEGDFDYSQMLELTSDLAWKLSLENDTVISLVFVSKAQFERVDTPFLLNVHRESIPVISE
jgi:predicted nucleotidyltransferase